MGKAIFRAFANFRGNGQQTKKEKIDNILLCALNEQEMLRILTNLK